MEKSESIKNLAKALMTFQSNMPVIPKEEVNPFFKSKYASLPTIIEYIKEPLAKVGLAYSQLPNGSQLTTILMHTESGEYLTSNYDLTLIKQDPQSMGSAITYARRYALGAILGLNIDNDDDGNAATGLKKTTTPKLENYQQKNDKKDFTPKPKVSACESCGTEITEKVKEYSEKHFNKALCFNCQKEQKK